MPDLDSLTLERLAMAFFTGDHKAVADMSSPYSVDDLVRAFTNLRQRMSRLIEGLTEDQINFSPDDNTYSLSEVISHLIASQGNTYNALLDIADSKLPHIDPVPRQPGGGAEKGLTAVILQGRLQTATDVLAQVMRDNYQPHAVKKVSFLSFGELTSKGWILFQLAHDLDHLKQAQVLRRSTGFPSKRGVTAR